MVDPYQGYALRWQMSDPVGATELDMSSIAPNPISTDIRGREKLIVALDCPTPAAALNLVEKLGDEVIFYKVGWRLFLKGGMHIVSELRDRGKDVFLDLKMDDIAETIETAVESIRDDAMLLTLQGTTATVKAAVKGRGERPFPKFLTVTLLSSLNEKDLGEMLSVTGVEVTADLMNRYILNRAERVLEAGSEGLIASGQSIKMIRDHFGPGPIIVSPGIRPAGSADQDHKRPNTPKSAIAAGADYLVVGRPIWQAHDELEAARAILAEIDEACR